LQRDKGLGWAIRGEKIDKEKKVELSEWAEDNRVQGEF
jgi:hypothetical protein